MSTSPAETVADSADVFKLESEAHGLADRLPELVIEALRVANTVSHGIHGRRRAGPGETFWQFRHFQSSDTAMQIDWRRSASSDHLFVREREWEAAHTVWLWSDLSPSMTFQSHLGPVAKRDRAVVLMLALAEMLVRGGERVALIGLMPPSANRKTTTKMAEIIATHGHEKTLVASLPPAAKLSRFSACVLFSDFLEPVPQLVERLEILAGDGVSGHLVQVMDPAEETLPYDGRTEFLGLEGDERMVADRVETLRDAYVARLAAHREAIRNEAHRLGWSFAVHRTDRPASEPLITLFGRLSGAARDYRWQAPADGSSGAGGGR